MFKNILVYTLNRTTKIDAEILREALPHFAYTPCGSQDIQKTGFVPHLKGYEELFYSANGQLLINVFKEDKIIPTSVINEEVAKKAEKYEEDHGAKPKKSEKDKMKDEVIMELLPRAFSRYSKTPVWIDMANHLIIVEAGSSKKAEDALALLRKALGSLPVTPLSGKEDPNVIMTEWVKTGEAVPNLEITDEVEMRSAADEGIVTSKKQSLQSEEVLNHIESGKFVSKLSFNYEDQMSFLLTDELAIKRIRMSDVINEKIASESGEDGEEASKFDAEFVIYTGEISKIIKVVMDAFNCHIED